MKYKIIISSKLENILTTAYASNLKQVHNLATYLKESDYLTKVYCQFKHSNKWCPVCIHL